MLKKAGFVAAAAAGLMMLGGTAALAAPAGDKGDYHHHHGKVWYPGSSTSVEKEQFGLLNTGDIDILDEVTIPICVNDVNLGLIVVDLLSPSGIADSCDAAVASDNGDGH
ncbi:hypothetical protein KIPE111705_38950 [Kibdelosporangium persicum]|uniref:Secreted protein n=1 Tax=Kibdelosporangium persicum TaxID=2698649 RepID=A0ABX2FA33_9PSEU|nr:hypothetical protein [Kibdelosporangium persicum]NRN67790.1 hypothetical protein [Kibdelosporangium persicum]